MKDLDQANTKIHNEQVANMQAADQHNEFRRHHAKKMVE